MKSYIKSIYKSILKNFFLILFFALLSLLFFSLGGSFEDTNKLFSSLLINLSAGFILAIFAVLFIDTYRDAGKERDFVQNIIPKLLNLGEKFPTSEINEIDRIFSKLQSSLEVTVSSYMTIIQPDLLGTVLELQDSINSLNFWIALCNRVKTKEDKTLDNSISSPLKTVFQKLEELKRLIK
jgi:hypothetical protein